MTASIHPKRDLRLCFAFTLTPRMQYAVEVATAISERLGCA